MILLLTCAGLEPESASTALSDPALAPGLAALGLLRSPGRLGLHLVASESEPLGIAAAADLHLNLKRRAGDLVEHEGLVDLPRIVELESAERAIDKRPALPALGLLHAKRRHVAGERARALRVLRALEHQRHEHRVGGLAEGACGKGEVAQLCFG